MSTQFHFLSPIQLSLLFFTVKTFPLYQIISISTKTCYNSSNLKEKPLLTHIPLPHLPSHFSIFSFSKTPPKICLNLFSAPTSFDLLQFSLETTLIRFCSHYSSKPFLSFNSNLNFVKSIGQSSSHILTCI